MLNKKYLIDITREVLNHMESEYLRSDFTGWREAASSIVNYILSNYTDITEFYIASGTFDGCACRFCNQLKDNMDYNMFTEKAATIVLKRAENDTVFREELSHILKKKKRIQKRIKNH